MEKGIKNCLFGTKPGGLSKREMIGERLGRSTKLTTNEKRGFLLG